MNVLRGCLVLIALAVAGCAGGPAADAGTSTAATPSTPSKSTVKSKAESTRARHGSGGIVKIVKTEDEWARLLTPAQFHVLREKGTERAGTGALLHEKRAGVFRCAACDLELFSSKSKFESGTGWPSFYEPIAAPNVTEIADDTYGMRRVEVVCSRCGGHLGHVFDDGPRPTGLRYCMNSVSLTFDPAEKAEKAEKSEKSEKAAAR